MYALWDGSKQLNCVLGIMVSKLIQSLEDPRPNIHCPLGSALINTRTMYRRIQKAS